MIDSVLPQTTSNSLLTDQVVNKYLIFRQISNIASLRLRVDGPSATFMEQ